jgi:F-type H+-transporting ATPase subunit delta
MSYVAFQYAEALFSVALEQNKIEEIEREFSAFVSAYDEEIKHFLLHPKVTKQEKKDVLKQVTDTDIFRHFLYVLIDNSRFELLNDIYREFKSIRDKQNKLMEVSVYSPSSLTDIELSKIKDSLAKKHNRKIRINNIVDEHIVGGLRLEYEGHVFDETINHYLKSLTSDLMK